MAGFFSLGGGRGRGSSSSSTTNQQQQQITPENWSLYRQNTTTTTPNEDISYKSFELWQDQTPQHHHHHHQQQQQNLYPSLAGGVGLGVGIVNFTDQHQQQQSSPRSASAALMMMRQQTGSTGTTSGGSGSGGGGSISCQDCGNQAKKDCVHMRCRTCCKSRGLQCSTHVKSTWVPASKRRERQDQLTSLQQQQLQNTQRENPKRLRENRQHNPAASSSSALARNLLLNTSSSAGLEIGNFPAEVNSPAVFRCVRVGSIDEADEQYAYQTAVNIGGHVFKGILYDHGPDHHHHGQYSSGPGESSSVGGGGNQQFNVIGGGASGGTNTGVTLAVASSSGGGGTVYLDPNLYPAPLNSFMAGTQFFPPPRT